jgi:hypothetical protein
MYEVSQALLGSGQLSQARQVAGEAVRRFDAADDPLRAALLLERYARALWMTGDLTMSLAALSRPPHRVATSSKLSIAIGLASLAGTLMLKDLNERSVEVGREAVAMARAANAPNVEAYAICGLGTALVNRGDCGAGLPLLRQAVAMAHELDIAAVDFHRTYANLSTALHLCGRLEESIAVALEGVQWAKSRGLWRLQGSFLEANAASALVDLGRWDEARTLIDQRDRPIVEGVSLLNHAVVADPGRPDGAVRGRSRASTRLATRSRTCATPSSPGRSTVGSSSWRSPRNDLTTRSSWPTRRSSA